LTSASDLEPLRKNPEGKEVLRHHWGEVYEGEKGIGKAVRKVRGIESHAEPREALSTPYRDGGGESFSKRAGVRLVGGTGETSKRRTGACPQKSQLAWPPFTTPTYWDDETEGA